MKRIRVRKDSLALVLSVSGSIALTLATWVKDVELNDHMFTIIFVHCSSVITVETEKIYKSYANFSDINK